MTLTEALSVDLDALPMTPDPPLNESETPDGRAVADAVRLIAGRISNAVETQEEAETWPVFFREQIDPRLLALREQLAALGVDYAESLRVAVMSIAALVWAALRQLLGIVAAAVEDA